MLLGVDVAAHIPGRDKLKAGDDHTGGQEDHGHADRDDQRAEHDEHGWVHRHATSGTEASASAGTSWSTHTPMHMAMQPSMCPRERPFFNVNPPLS